jgi:nitronate monooxygenase
VVTQLFDGGWPARRHRVLRNALTARRAERLPRSFIAVTRHSGRPLPIARYAATVPSQGTQGRIDEMAMYCGRSVDAVNDLPSAAERVRQLVTGFRNHQAAAG